MRERTTGDTYVLPGHGDGTFGRTARTDHALRGRPRVSPSATWPATAPRTSSPLDGGRVEAWVNPGGFDLGRPIDTGADLSGADQILVAGDWDRDGYGDVVTRQARTGNLVLWRGDGHGHLARDQGARHGVRHGRQADRGRGHDRRRLSRT